MSAEAPSARGGRARSPVVTLLTAMLMVMPAFAETDRKDAVDEPEPAESTGFRTPLITDEVIPLQLDNFPQRPRPLIDLGSNAFFAPGPIPRGHVWPTGVVVQPQFIAWGELRSAMQNVELSGVPAGAPSTLTTEWVNRLDLFGSLYLTPTERFVVGIRPLDRTNSAGVTRWFGYRHKPEPVSGWETGVDGNVETLFFEGDFASLFRNVDPDSTRKADYHFTIGRQTLVMQQGLLAAGPVDMLGVTRTATYGLGANSTRASFLYAWDKVSRNNNRVDPKARMAGVSVAADYDRQLWEFDALYVGSNTAGGGDSLHVALALNRQINVVNTTFRVMGSSANDGDSAATSTGGLLFGQFAVIQPFTENIIYLNTFYGINRFASAMRGAEFGGPLGQTGILFAAVGMGRFPPALGNRADNAHGAGLGWQIFFDDEKRRQLVLEAGYRESRVDGPGDAVAFAARYQHAIGQRMIAIVEGYRSSRRANTDLRGLRAELLFRF